MKTLRIILFYLLSLTWGLILTAVGIVVGLLLLITGHKPKLFHHYIRFEVGHNWGGFELGPIFVTDKEPTTAIMQHEAGHGIQNIMFGPIMPFLICIPSAIRYWLRECKTYEAKRLFVLLLFIVTLVISLTMSTIGYLYCQPLGKIFYCVTVYIVPITVWLLASELPKYEDDMPYVDYDDIWFEGMATRLGEKYFGGQTDGK